MYTYKYIPVLHWIQHFQQTKSRQLNLNCQHHQLNSEFSMWRSKTMILTHWRLLVVVLLTTFFCFVMLHCNWITFLPDFTVSSPSWVLPSFLPAALPSLVFLGKGRMDKPSILCSGSNQMFLNQKIGHSWLFSNLMFCLKDSLTRVEWRSLLKINLWHNMQRLLIVLIEEYWRSPCCRRFHSLTWINQLH